MAESNEICRLDYFFGTLATAYKGVITSLVAKDFCMTAEDNFVILKGTILSMPEGGYEARLIYEGIELARAVIRGGSFEFAAENERIASAKNLQIDIVQKGRHIGTFLLKRDRPDDFYTSAVELSGDLKDFDPRALTARLHNRVGLLKGAEDIISKILSAKKDWIRLSEEINSFSKDLFWSDSAAFAAWYRVLVKWSSKACSMASEETAGRAESNLLSLIELPLENRSHITDFHSLVDAWLAAVEGKGIDLASHVKQSARVLSLIHEYLPDVDISHAVKGLLHSLRQRVLNAPALNDEALFKIQAAVTADDLSLLNSYSEKRKAETIGSINAAEALVSKGEYARILETAQEIGAVFLNDAEMIDLFYAAIERNANVKSAIVLTDAVCSLFPAFPFLSSGSLRNAMSGTARFVKKLLSLNMTDACDTILAEIGKGTAELKERILLNPEVAASIIASGDKKLVFHYKALLKQIYIPSPKVTGFSTETWAEIANPQHLERLSKFLAVLGVGNAELGDVPIYLLCNLYVSVVFIPDDRLFQREISSYLNSNALSGNFLFNYLLLKKLPVYFNEVGATSTIRDDSTEIDSWANDTVLYFLRKQIHVNASNYNIRLIEEIIRSWVSDDPVFLGKVVPADVFNAVNRDLLAQYHSAVRPLFDALKVLDDEGLHFDRLLKIADKELDAVLAGRNVPDEIRMKIILICRLYRETVKKYALVGIQAQGEDTSRQLTDSVGRIRMMKETVISPEKTIPHESLYYKRHIAFGIPSVLGTYHEAKFDALAEILKIENMMTVIFEEIISEIEQAPADFTGADYGRWVRCLDAMNELLKVHDMSNFQTDEVMAVLKTNTLYASQVVDLLRIWQRELTWMVNLLNREIHGPLVEILKVFPRDEIPEYLRGLGDNDDDYINKAADIITRDIISSITGFVEMDRFIGILINKLHSRPETVRDISLSLTEHPGAEPESGFYVPATLRDSDSMRLAPLIGGKAKNLVYLMNRDLPVPRAVVLSAKKTPDYREYKHDERFLSVLKNGVAAIEARTGLIFGDIKKPLFLSARSGSYISMPGILSSILYCGMNTGTVKAFSAATGNPRLAWDSYRRFIEQYTAVVFGLDEKIFSDILSDFTGGKGAERIDDLDSEHLEEIAGLYLQELDRRNLKIPYDVYEQLREAVCAVYRSFYGEKALHFRKAMDISEHWGTSVLLMQMVSGNQKGSGASVFFTRNPSTLEKGVYGDTRESATGDDLVRGKFINRPLSRAQELKGQESLETVDPELFMMHEKLAAEIENAMGGLPQEVEATYATSPEGKRIIYVLQTRRMEFHRGFIKHFEDVCRMESGIIGRGVGVNGGALSGTATFADSQEQIEKLKQETKMPVILLRKLSSTQDVSLMPYINGIITSAGGATSHAAILSQKFGITSVVGCSDMQIETDEKGAPVARIGNYAVNEGSMISIDGSTGLVYSGICEFTRETEQ